MRGFVLIELLIALAILSVIFFYFAPVSVNLFQPTTNEDAKKLNLLIEKAYKKARETGLPQYIVGEKGSKTVFFGKRSVRLSGEVFTVEVDGNYQRGLSYRFGVYPCGVMDKVKMVLYGEKELVSLPLLAEFKPK